MASVASRDCSAGHLDHAALSIASVASSESLAWAALAAVEHEGLMVEGQHLGSGPAAVERLAADTDVVLIMEDDPQACRGRRPGSTAQSARCRNRRRRAGRHSG